MELDGNLLVRTLYEKLDASQMMKSHAKSDVRVSLASDMVWATLC